MAMITPIVAGRGIDPGSAPSTARDDSIGAALRGFGNELGQVGNALGDQELRLIQQRQKVDEFKQEQLWQQTKLKIAADYDQAKTNMDPSGAGFTEAQQKAFIGQYDEFLKQVPEYLRPQFNELVQTDKQGRVLQAAADEVSQRNTWYEVGVSDTVNQAQTQVSAYPELFQQTLTEVSRTIDATGLPPAKKADLKRQAEEMLGTAWFERVMQDDPSSAKTKLGIGGAEGQKGYFDAIRSAESGGNDGAKNPNSSATGRYQFTEPTWDGLLRRYPGSGLTKDGRTDPAQQEVAIRLFTAENARQLSGAGIETSNANLYAAHFLGAGGAVAVLKAPDGAALAGVVSPEVITANPFLKGMTVGRFKAWAAEKVGGAGGVSQPAPEVANLPFNERLKLYDQAVAAENQLATQAKANTKLAYDAEKGGLELAIEKGEVASEQSILDSALDDGDKATLLGKLKAAQAKDTEARAVLDAYSNGALPSINPYDADQKKAVGDAYELLMKSTPDDQKAAVTANFVAETGVVPDPVVASVRRNLASTDVATVANGLSQAAMLDDVAKDGLSAVEHGKELSEAAAAYRVKVDQQGMTVEQAAAELVRNRDPEQKQKAETLDARWKQELKDKKFGVEDVLAEFDGGLFGGGKPLAGVDNFQSDAMLAFYFDAAERAFKGTANGDTAVAKQIALGEVKRTFNVSETSGERSLMKYPPEMFYPARNGSHSYLRDLVLKSAKSVEPGATDAYLLPDSKQTGQDIRAGRAPRYNLFYTRPDGVVEMAPGYFEVTNDELKSLSDLDSEQRALEFQIGRQDTLATQQAWGGAPRNGYGPETGWTPPLNPAPAPRVDPALRQKLQEVQTKRVQMLGGENKPQMATSDPLEAERKFLEQRSSAFGVMGGGN